jgi:Electron transfer DM13
MKLNQLGWIAIAAAVTTLPIVSCATPAPSTSASPVAVMAKATTLSGKFVQAEKPTTGTARIITEKGHRYLELDQAFSTSDQGPDLHVLLDPKAKPPASYEHQGAVINLGRLRSYQGTQRYPIPDVIQLNNYKSVVIWCRMANATFGYAPIAVR